MNLILSLFDLFRGMILLFFLIIVLHFIFSPLFIFFTNSKKFSWIKSVFFTDLVVCFLFLLVFFFIPFQSSFLSVNEFNLLERIFYLLINIIRLAFIALSFSLLVLPLQLIGSLFKAFLKSMIENKFDKKYVNSISLILSILIISIIIYLFIVFNPWIITGLVFLIYFA